MIPTESFLSNAAIKLQLLCLIASKCFFAIYPPTPISAKFEKFSFMMVLSLNFYNSIILNWKI